MSQEKTRYKAVIAGNTYTIIGTESKEHMDMVVELVNRQLHDIMELSSQTNLEQAAILLAINALSDQVKKEAELLPLRKEVAELRNKAQKVDELEARIQRIDVLETQAKQALKENGTEKIAINHIEAQQIMNQQTKNKIKQNHQE